MDKKTQEGFWSKILIPVDALEDCWEWLGSRQKRGYGGFRGKRTHRVMWELVYGPVPSGKYVCHRCDNPSCCNPLHLFVGSAKENYDDAVSKKRHRNVTLGGKWARGETHGHAKLREDQVVEIRECYARGEATREDLAKKHGVHYATIRHLLRRDSWKHVGGPIGVRGQAGNRGRAGTAHPASRFDEDQVREIKRCWAMGKTTCAQIASKLGVPRQTVSNIVHGRAWKHVTP